ncbi:H-type lectin domain-containing protein [Polyangium sorediatum]|uniref:H-type lectin domain-containing protein n=2 Tax=Polyangium sorediatum TaxID=889274 RepID=A0ABT6NSU2_9BACT|nr:H-type lectin domain-containing protein [Polyangium sorediatum]MDI1431410.1 H-type lectin domain-containing protein [Polyangium sorediatum]
MLLGAPTYAEATTIQSGTIPNNYTVNAGAWALYTENGLRTFVQHINFSAVFATAPTVIVSISGLDSATTPTSVRLGVEALNVTPSGFDLRYGTWADSVVYGATVSWVAYSP